MFVCREKSKSRFISNRKNWAVLLAFLLFSLLAVSAEAETYLQKKQGRDSLIGAVGYVSAKESDTLADIARRFDLGYDELVKANPKVNRWVPTAGARVIIPSQFVLPAVPQEGIVINLSELRLYYFPPADGGEARLVHTYPVSVGRIDWPSPLGSTTVSAKEVNPSWCPTPAIRLEHASEGEELPNCIPGGIAENPLGRFALRLSLPQYLIHGTDERKEYGIGMRVTHGCIRLYPEDIEELFSLVSPGTPVRFIKQAVKAGWKDSGLYLEVQAPLEEDSAEFAESEAELSLEQVLSEIRNQAPELTKLNLSLIKKVYSRRDGIPTLIHRTESELPPFKR